jgi:hypothetical protein
LLFIQKQNLINFVRNSGKDFDVNNVRNISRVIVGRNSGKDFDVNNIRYIFSVIVGFWCRLMMIALYYQAKTPIGFWFSVGEI